MDSNNLTFPNSQYGPLDLDKGSDMVDITGCLLCKLQVFISAAVDVPIKDPLLPVSMGQTVNGRLLVVNSVTDREMY